MATRLVRWDPFREVASLQSELSRVMNAFREADAGPSQGWIPAVDVWETENELVYAFDLPGVPQDKIAIELQDNAVTVSGERERSQEMSRDSAYRFERRFGSFARTLPLPQGVGDDQVRAEYRDGVLELHVAKPETPKPRRIQVNAQSNGTRTIEGQATKQ